MTYTQLIEAKWDNCGDDLVLHEENYMASLPEPDQTAFRIIAALLERKGFEYWWVPNAGGMAAECNDEIFEDIKRIITNGVKLKTTKP